MSKLEPDFFGLIIMEIAAKKLNVSNYFTWIEKFNEHQ